MSLPWTVAFLALCALVLVLAVLLLGTLRRITPVLASAEETLRSRGDQQAPPFGGLPAGAQVPPFELRNPAGDVVRPGDDLPLPATFLFVSEGCEPCEDLLADLAQWDDPVNAGKGLHIVASDEEFVDDVRMMLQGRNLPILWQQDGEASAAFDQQATPQAFGVDADSKITFNTVVASAEHLGEEIRGSFGSEKARSGFEDRGGDDS